MLGRIVEVSHDQRHLSLYRGFMVVTTSTPKREEIGRVALDDMAALIANAYGLSYTNNLLVALAQRGVPMVLCTANHNAVGVLWPLDGHHQQSHRIEAQINSPLPQRKRIWAMIVRRKIEYQAWVLECVGKPHAPLSMLAKQVRSGDPENLEGQAARKYWSTLFNSLFRRDRDASGINSYLNYGYTVLRAATARAIVAAGLHPSIGLHHSHDNNPMRLVDDAMEPFRPFIDLAVWRLQADISAELPQAHKRELVQCLYQDVETDAGRTPLFVVIQRFATSIAMIFTNERKTLDLSPPPNKRQ